MPIVGSSSEFVVNASAADAGDQATVAGHADGTFMVAWRALTQPFVDGESRNSYDILSRAFAADNALTGDVVVNTERADPQWQPQIAGRFDGSYVVAYRSGEDNRLPGTSVVSQILGATGAGIGAEEFGVYSYQHFNPDVAVAPDGRFVVVSKEEMNSEARLHASDGRIVDTSDFGFTTDSDDVAVTTLDASGYLLLWTGYSDEADADEDGVIDSIHGLYGQFGSFSGGTSEPFLVLGNDVPASGDTSARLLNTGDVALTWVEEGSVFAAVLAGTDLRGAPIVVSDASFAQRAPELAVLDTGQFVIVWQDDPGRGGSGDGSGSSIMARLFNADGTADGLPFRVNQDVAHSQLTPSVAAIGGGRFVVTWSDEDGVQARIFDVDGSAQLPTAPLFTRAGTIDLSPQEGQTVLGGSGPNSFYIDTAAVSGRDRVRNFDGDDVLLTSAPLLDGNGDGLIAFGSNGRLDLGGGNSIRFDGLKALRLLGTTEELSIYGDAAVRPIRAVEGTFAADKLSGDVGGTMVDTFFFDTALGVGLGNDIISAFGASDILVARSAIADDNGDGIIRFGADRMLDLAGSDIAIHSTTGARITSLEFDGVVQHDGLSYFVYSRVGSAAGTGDLHFSS